ncbi:MAG: hypothetical protein WBG37_00455 [Desulfobacterales bacterium]
MTIPGQERERAAWRRFEEMLRYTLVGFIGGLTAGALLDFFQYPLIPLGQWLVRAGSGQGPGLVAVHGAVTQERRRGAFAMARTYGRRRLVILVLPWLIDGLSRRWGVDTSGVAGFYIPCFYGLTAQLEINLRAAGQLRRSAGSWGAALSVYRRDPAWVTGALVLVGAPLALLLLRLSGFQPLTYTRTAVETILVSLCWLPPLVAWLKVRSSRSTKQ